MDFTFHPTAAGVALAAVAVAGGARLFGMGLRALRVTRGMSSLAERPLTDVPCGLLHTRGRVVLDSPLFAPLSGRPCAGFRLEVRGKGTRAGASIEERRIFRITGGEVTARVLAAAGRWRMSETGRREAQPGERISESIDALLDSRAEVAVLRRRGVGLVLTEHALLAGSECHVVGWSRRPRPYEMPVALELARTGTDDDSEATDAGAAPRAPSRGWFAPERRQPGRPFPHDVDLWVDGGSHEDGPLVSDAAPQRADLVMSRWDAVALALGPVLCLGGLLFLAHAAEQLRDRARF